MSHSLPVSDSPCIGVCRLNAEGLCVGCWRTLDEIARWGGLEPAERRRLMDDVLPGRALLRRDGRER